MSKANFLKSATLAVAGLAVVTSVSSCSLINKKSEEKHSCKSSMEKEKHSCKTATNKKESKKTGEATKPAETKKAN